MLARSSRRKTPFALLTAPLHSMGSGMTAGVVLAVSCDIFPPLSGPSNSTAAVQRVRDVEELCLVSQWKGETKKNDAFRMFCCRAEYEVCVSVASRFKAQDWMKRTHLAFS